MLNPDAPLFRKETTGAGIYSFDFFCRIAVRNNVQHLSFHNQLMDVHQWTGTGTYL
jgi:hypothetical protein